MFSEVFTDVFGEVITEVFNAVFNDIIICKSNVMLIVWNKH
jgi:hypothetical protein